MRAPGLWLLILSTAGFAQDAATLRVTTRMMQVNVVVRDSAGHPVEGLTQNDFTITESGKQQKIATFSTEDLRKKPTAPQSLPPGIFTNRSDLLSGVPSNVIVILFDLLNMRAQDQATCREQLLKFLREQVRPDDRVALYALGSQLRVLHEFTNGAGELIKAAGRHVPQSTPALKTSKVEAEDGGNSALDNFLANGSDPAFSAGHMIRPVRMADRIKMTIAALDAITNHLAGLPRRKTLVWISSGVPFSTGMAGPMDRGDLEYYNAGTQIQRAVRAMNTIDLTIYPIDGQGLRVVSAPNAASRRETMRTLADQTGGKMFIDNNDISGALRTAVDDSRFTYVLGYYPSHGRWDGHFQDVKVAVNRHGVSVRHRPGYLALSKNPESPETPLDREAGLKAAINSLLELTGIRMVVGVTPNMPAPGRLTLRLTIDPADVRLVEQEGHWRGLLDVAYVQQSSPQKPVEIARDRFNFDFSAETQEMIQKKGLIIEKELAMAASTYHLKVVARAVSTGACGSVDVITK